MRLAIVGLTAFGLLVLLAKTAAPLLLEEINQRPGCVPYPRTIQASAVHLQAGFDEHQSWVDFTVPSAVRGYYQLCVDGHLLEQGGGEFDFPDGLARFHVRTRWIDLLWLTGELDGYRELSRWQLRLVCDLRVPC